jgi:hypothetical protein
MRTDMDEQDRELLGAIYVQLSRILDALYVIAGPEKGEKLNSLHAGGGILSSEPLLIIAEDDDE